MEIVGDDQVVPRARVVAREQEMGVRDFDCIYVTGGSNRLKIKVIGSQMVVMQLGIWIEPDITLLSPRLQGNPWCEVQTPPPKAKVIFLNISQPTQGRTRRATENCLEALVLLRDQIIGNHGLQFGQNHPEFARP